MENLKTQEKATRGKKNSWKKTQGVVGTRSYVSPSIKKPDLMEIKFSHAEFGHFQIEFYLRF